MLAEKRSFYRFLSIYLFSTFILLALGAYFYYKLSYNNIINKNIMQMRDNIYNFIELNQEKHYIITNKKPNFNGFKIAIYLNHKELVSSFNPQKIYFNKFFWQIDNQIFYRYHTKKRWGDLDFITFKNISTDIYLLKKRLSILIIFSLIFVIFIAYILGKIFLNPMKQTIILLEEFITDATHEINTPISNILANIELMQEFYPNLKESEEFKKIVSSSFRISEIFKDLSYVKLNHRPKRVIIELDVEEVLKSRILFFKTMIDSRDLIIKMDTISLIVSMDREDLIRIIDNLLVNAIKYSPKKTTIKIKLANYLEVVNDGKIKCPKRVFDKFIREDKEKGGFGLGLYIVKKICKEYKFKFIIANYEKNVLFRVYFK